ncbi:MAG: HisA/HisF-related TIM barrel protein [Candidatus Heimdallarchaeota archaeon]
MKVIPVLDILDGVVVHGVAGKRKNYRPIEQSIISSSPEPFIVASNFAEKLGLKTFYIADLNLIQKTENSNCNENSIWQIAQNKRWKIMLDGGVETVNEAIKLFSWGVDKVILGTETIESLETVSELVKVVGGEKILVSIDLVNGQILAKNERLQKMPLLELLEFIEPLQLYAVIVLDIRKVGKSTGPISKPLLEILARKPKTPIFAGGGVRNITDVIALKKMAVGGCLIATAFHKGIITKDDLPLVL